MLTTQHLIRKTKKDGSYTSTKRSWFVFGYGSSALRLDVFGEEHVYKSVKMWRGS